jgi:hypothetical protein
MVPVNDYFRFVAFRVNNNGSKLRPSAFIVDKDGSKVLGMDASSYDFETGDQGFYLFSAANKDMLSQTRLHLQMRKTDLKIEVASALRQKGCCP